MYTRSIDGGTALKATLVSPRKELNIAIKHAAKPPAVGIEEYAGQVPFLPESASGTVIELRGYDHPNTNAFAHDPLRDYICWFTAWGQVSAIWGNKLDAPCTLRLKGIGSPEWETIEYGHPFPAEEFDFRTLRKKDDRRPENSFVRRWVSEPLKVLRYPEHELRIVFSVEGDSAKREHNSLLKRVGRPTGKPYPYEWARYTVSDRYGIYVCKDGIPIERKNERFADRSEWTKWHAFINCQAFHLTANRSSVENTPADMLSAIYETAERYISDHILGSDEYEDFARRIELEAGRRKAEREKRDVSRRYKEYCSKKKFRLSGDGKATVFLAPRTEQGVVWLLARLVELWPKHFPKLKVIDLDSHFGYDLLVLRKHHLTEEEEPAFLELKFALRDSADFNHSFDYLSGIVCWETGLQADEELVDIQARRRVFKITPPDDERPYTKYFLNNPSGGLNIEVTVLRKYLGEVLHLEEL